MIPQIHAALCEGPMPGETSGQWADRLLTEDRERRAICRELIAPRFADLPDWLREDTLRAAIRFECGPYPMVPICDPYAEERR